MSEPPASVPAKACGYRLRLPEALTEFVGNGSPPNTASARAALRAHPISHGGLPHPKMGGAPM